MTQIPSTSSTNCSNCGAAVSDVGPFCPACGFRPQPAVAPAYPQAATVGGPAGYDQIPGPYDGSGWGPTAGPQWGAWPQARPKTTNLKLIIGVVVAFKFALIFVGLVFYFGIALMSGGR